MPAAEWDRRRIWRAFSEKKSLEKHAAEERHPVCLCLEPVHQIASVSVMIAVKHLSISPIRQKSSPERRFFYATALPLYFIRISIPIPLHHMISVIQLALRLRETHFTPHLPETGGGARLFRFSPICSDSGLLFRGRGCMFIV